jgi:hypothetical protein
VPIASAFAPLPFDRTMCWKKMIVSPAELVGMLLAGQSANPFPASARFWASSDAV